MGWSVILDILNKFLPNRKAAMVDQLNNLTADYQAALKEGRDTDAASLKVQIDALRKKVDFTDGDV